MWADTATSVPDRSFTLGIERNGDVIRAGITADVSH